MLPVIALIGRPNVGKSTLFNYLTRSREALVADYPGLTRDRQYGRIKRGEKDCLLVDTGGISDPNNGIDAATNQQIQIALLEADCVFFLVDARAGVNSSDQAIAASLRKLNKPIVLVVNKTDGLNADLAALDFYALALGDPINIAATHGSGVPALLARIDTLIPTANEAITTPQKGIGVAIVGRPNVGKSTLVNRLLGEQRVVVFDQAGTTRDSIYIPFTRDQQQFTLIDTAGLRRKAKVTLLAEKFSIIKALQAVEKSNVVIYLIDAQEGITDQDARLLSMIIEAGRALIIGLNKWDGASIEQKNQLKRQLDIKLPFLDFAEKHPISALHGSGVGKLFDVVHDLYDAAMTDMSTPIVTRILKEATTAHQPPTIKNRRIKLKYAHQGGQNPPTIVVHGTQTDILPAAYKRYLINYFRTKLALKGTPIKLILKSTQNPFAGQKNKLTQRQTKKRNRMIKHHQKK